jgi:predicted MFS family arabinose efflux permease
VHPAAEPLRVKPFGRLLTSYTINEIGDSVGIIALALLVYAETRSPLATTGLFLALNVGPAFLAPALTARLDRVPLRRALPLIYLTEAVVFGVLALLAEDRFLLPLILLLGLLDGVLALTGRGLTRAAVGALLEPHGQLRAGNALLNVAFAVASVGGAAAGGLLAGTAGIGVAFAIDAASFLLVSALLAVTSDLPQVVAAPKRVGSRLREGLGFVRRHPLARGLLVGEGFAIVLFTVVVPIEVFYARDTLGADESGFGLLLASWGAGMVVGSLLFIVAKRLSLTLLVLGSTTMIGAAYLGMSVAETLAAACALSVLGGAGNGVQWVSVVTALQEATPLDLQARVMALLESVNRAAPAIGFVAGGLLVNAFSPRTAFAAAGCGVLALVTVGGLVVLRLRPSLPAPPAG